jgi:hypothetical protein
VGVPVDGIEDTQLPLGQQLLDLYESGHHGLDMPHDEAARYAVATYLYNERWAQANESKDWSICDDYGWEQAKTDPRFKILMDELHDTLRLIEEGEPTTCPNCKAGVMSRWIMKLEDGRVRCDLCILDDLDSDKEGG